MSNQNKYKLSYFQNIRGRAEVPRLMLEEKQASYEVNMIALENWSKEKSKLEFGQLPILEEISDNHHYKIPQSQAIIRFLAKRLGLNGKTEEENIRCEVLQEQIVDYNTKYVFPLGGERDEKKIPNLISNCEPLFKMLTKILKDNSKGNGKHFVGDDITYIDFLVYGLLDSFVSVCDESRSYLEKFEDLINFQKSINERKNISDYIKSNRRPEYSNYANFNKGYAN